MMPGTGVVPDPRVQTASSANTRRRRTARLAVILSALVLLPLISACGDPELSYVFVDGDHRDYALSVVVAEKGLNGETLGTVTLEALLRAEVNIDRQAPCACFVTVDYGDVKISTTGSAQSNGEQIPTAYFHLCGMYGPRVLAFNAPAPRSDNYSFEIARTGPNGSLSVMLLNTFVGKCFAQPLRDCRHELKTGNEWTSIERFPGEYVTYLYPGKGSANDQNRETTQVKVTGLPREGAIAELAWTSYTPLMGSTQVDLTERLLRSGVDPSQIGGLTYAGEEVAMTMSGASNCSGTTFIRTSDGWPERASVDRMIIDLTYFWSYPEDLLSFQPEPAKMILDITGSIEATS